MSEASATPNRPVPGSRAAQDRERSAAARKANSARKPLIRPTANAKVEEVSKKQPDPKENKAENRPKKFIPASQKPEEVGASEVHPSSDRQKVIPVVAPPMATKTSIPPATRQTAKPPPPTEKSPETVETKATATPPPTPAAPKPLAKPAAPAKPAPSPAKAKPKEKPVSKVSVKTPPPAAKPAAHDAKKVEKTPPVVPNTPPKTIPKASPAPKKAKKFWMLWAAISILLLGGIAYLLFFSNFFDGIDDTGNAPTEEKAPASTENEELEATGELDNATTDSPTNETIEETPLTGDESESMEADVEPEAASTEIEEEAPLENSDPEPSTPVENVADAADLSGQWIVSLAAVGSEGNAKIQSEKMKAKGFDKAGFFFLPDVIADSKALYKIYLGPFATREAATSALEQAKAEHPNAYCQKVP